MSENALLYALSTLAQTCAALAAFVGAVGLYRLQSLRDEHARNERTLRGRMAGAILSPEDASRLTTEEVVRIARANVTERSSAPAAVIETLRKGLAERDGFPNRFSHATTALLIFEAWNLLVIGASLVGFNYMPLLVSSPYITSWALWAAAIGTVGVTGFGVYAWTRG